MEYELYAKPYTIHYVDKESDFTTRFILVIADNSESAEAKAQKCLDTHNESNSSSQFEPCGPVMKLCGLCISNSVLERLFILDKTREEIEKFEVYNNV